VDIFLEEKEALGEPVRQRNSSLKSVLIISIIINSILALGLTTLYIENTSQTERISNLQFEVQQFQEQLKYYITLNENLSVKIESLKKQTDVLESQAEFYKTQAEYYSRQLTDKSSKGEITGSAIVNVVAVREISQSQFKVEYEGVTMRAEVELKAGEGRILINTEPRMGIDLQTSVRTAALVAENITTRQMDLTDIILTVKGEEEADIVDGPSAGAAITVALIAAIENKTLNPSIYITGTINPDGTVGVVGGVAQKALAAADSGASKFLVPQGLTTINVPEYEKSEPIPGFTVIIERTRSLNLEDFLTERGYQIEVVEIQYVTEAYQMMVIEEEMSLQFYS
jgi:predicted ATP-dependent protease